MEFWNKAARKKPFFFLWILCILGSWSVLPTLFHLGILPSTASVWKVFFFSTVQSALFFGLICWLSYLLVPKTDLTPFAAKKPLKRIVYPGVISGILVGLILYSLEKTIFSKSLLAGMHPPAWSGILASLYGGVNEEVLMRLFLFTLIYFLFRKIFKFSDQNRIGFLWATNGIVAIAFGVGHLPALFKLITPTSFEISRVLVLNAIPGLVFGWLYWSRGLWAAMAAHFTTDLMIHAFLI